MVRSKHVDATGKPRVREVEKIMKQLITPGHDRIFSRDAWVV